MGNENASWGEIKWNRTKIHYGGVKLHHRERNYIMGSENTSWRSEITLWVVKIHHGGAKLHHGEW